MIKLESVSKTYQSKAKSMEALKQLSLSFDDVGFVCIVGPSGCGKTTLLNIIGGLDRPSSGDVAIDGISTKDFDEKTWSYYRNQKLGFVFQNYYLIPHLSVIKNVELPLEISGYRKQQKYQIAQNILSRLNLSDFDTHTSSELSGGQQQKAAIARALVLNPNIILADEPTGSLDYDSSIEIMDMLKQISKDRLVIMVTHHVELAKKYATRMIKLKDGQVYSDQQMEEFVKTQEDILPEIQTTKMSLLSSFRLSFFNLLHRKYRTILSMITASLGIMGLLLVLSISIGYNQYIESRKVETLNAFPIRVERVSYVVPLLDPEYIPNLPVFPDELTAYPRNIQYEFQTINTLNDAYYTHLQNMDSTLYKHIHYDYKLGAQFVVKRNQDYYDPSSYIKQTEVDETYIEEHFDIVYGRVPQDTSLEAFIVIDRYHRLSKDIVQSLGYSGNESLSLEDLTDIPLKYIPNDALYTTDGTLFTKQPLNITHQSQEAIDIPVVGVIRMKEKFEFDFLRTGIYYTLGVTDYIKNDAAASQIVAAQILSQDNVLDGQSLTNTQKETVLRNLGYATYPVAYQIYSTRFEEKDLIMQYLKTYNDQVPLSQAVEPLDITGIGLSTMRIVIDGMTYVLLVFSMISLIISLVMLGMSSYTSVIERTKEIGMLRSIGARKKDIRNMFFSETLMVGFGSSVLGCFIAYLLLPLLNLALNGLTTIPRIASLPIFIAIFIIIVTTILTSLSGIIPAQIASNKDPIEAMRSEI